MQVENISHRYGDRVALRGVSFEGHAGEVIALAGKNGSGKTTLLKHLIGLLRADSGRILLAGNDIAREPVQSIARMAGYVPQHPTSILHRETVRDEIAFTLRAQGLTADIDEIATELGIDALLDRHPLDLSGGQRQRVALAAIAVARPRILLLDEPTRGLAGHAKTELAHFIRRYADQGRLVIVATHDVEFLVQCASRVLMLADGEVITDGSPAGTLAGSLTFGTQMNRLHGGNILSLSDAGVPEFSAR